MRHHIGMSVTSVSRRTLNIFVKNLSVSMLKQVLFHSHSLKNIINHEQEYVSTLVSGQCKEKSYCFFKRWRILWNALTESFP